MWTFKFVLSLPLSPCLFKSLGFLQHSWNCLTNCWRVSYAAFGQLFRFWLQISCLGYILNKCIKTEKKKFALSFLFFIFYIHSALSLLLCCFCSFSNSIKHTYCLCCSFCLLLFLLLFLFIYVHVYMCECVRVCVIYIISLLQKFTLIVGTIFWHFGFTTLRCFWQLLRRRRIVQTYIHVCSRIPLIPNRIPLQATHSALHHLWIWQHVRFPFVCLCFPVCLSLFGPSLVAL